MLIQFLFLSLSKFVNTMQFIVHESDHYFFVLYVVADQKLTSQVHEIVGRINGRFGTLTAVPIHHLVCFVF